MNKRPFIIGAVLILILIFTGILFVRAIIFSEGKKMREELLLQAQLIKESVNLQNILKFSATEEDLRLEDYKILKDKLARIRSVYPKCRFIYLLAQHPDGNVFFFLDSEPADSKDYSPPGQIFSEVAENIRNIFSTAEGIVDGPQKDRWGTWVSAFAPVYNDQTGALIAVLGMDIDARAWMQTIFMRSLLSISFFLVASILIGIFLFLLYRNKQSNLRLVNAQSALQESENKYFRLFLNFYDAMLVFNPDTGKFITANPAMYEMFGINNEQQLLTLGPVDLSPEFQPDGSVSTKKAEELIKICLSHGPQFFEWRHKRFSGEEFPAMVWMSKIELSGIIALQVIIRDVTKSKKIEEDNARHIKELEIFYKVSMGREERIIELKNEVEKLKKELAKFQDFSR